MAEDESTHVDSGAPSPFVRQASGVIRSWSPLDGFIYNMLAINVVIMLAFAYYQSAVGFPNGNLTWALVIAGIFCIAEGITYAILVATMPRSGGDYVFQSRILGGGVAVLFGFTSIVLTQVFWFGLVAFSGINTVFAPFLTLMGLKWHQAWMMHLSTWMQTTTGFLVMSVIFILWAMLINIWGMRAYSLVQRYVFYVAIILFLVMLGILAFHTRADFIASFNDVMVKTTGVSGGYAQLIANAKAGGLHASHASVWSSTWGMVPLQLIALMFLVWGVAQGGEIKSGGSLRAQMFQMPGAVLASTILGAALAGLLVSRLGTRIHHRGGISRYAWR